MFPCSKHVGSKRQLLRQICLFAEELRIPMQQRMPSPLTLKTSNHLGATAVRCGRFEASCFATIRPRLDTKSAGFGRDPGLE